jgi:chemotaxis protein histidine kinase CheA
MSVEKKVNGTPMASPEPRFDPRALAEAEAIRTRAAAEAEAARIKAAGEAEAEKIKAAEEARKQKILNDKAESRAREEEAARAARIAESNSKRQEAERAQEKQDREALQAQEDEAKLAEEIAAADEKWRAYAIRFAIVCGIVSLPVQMSFFWNPKAPWMAAAPIMLEGAAWVVHRGARAAAVSKRPVWHYRTIVWLLALIAAGVNLYHGLHSFDPGTAIATAFASIAGPGVWDLHEHGRLRKRDGALTRKERRAAERAAKAEAQRLAAEQQKKAADEGAARKAAEAAAAKLAADREVMFPKVWQHAVKLAADLGQTTVTNAIWAQAKFDVEGAKPGESADVIRMRNAAEARVAAAREKRPVNGSSQQVASQVLGPKQKRVYNPPARPGKRRKGDVKFTSAARRQASIAAKQTAGKKD